MYMYKPVPGGGAGGRPAGDARRRRPPAGRADARG